jgi:tRNA(Leu) C34 or U34 (ribose-2'-O)-methylase TrmL
MDILLYATENPRNLGSIIRTSVALGLDKIHLYDEHKLLESPELIDTTRAVCRRNRESRIDIISVDEAEQFIDSYTNKYATVVGPKSKRMGDPKDNLKFLEDSLIIFGSEGYGLPRKIGRRKGVEKFVIPTINVDDCFGLAEAYSMVLFEYFRQHPDKLPKYSRKK